MHDGIEVTFDNYRGGQEGKLILRVPGRPEQRFPNMHIPSWLSPSGNYILAVPYSESGLGATVIIDIRTGEMWTVPAPVYTQGPMGTPQLAWSYGDIAMVPTTDGDSEFGGSLACDAAHRTCERLPAERPLPDADHLNAASGRDGLSVRPQPRCYDGTHESSTDALATHSSSAGHRVAQSFDTIS